MNTGLRDVRNLAWKRSFVVKVASAVPGCEVLRDERIIVLMDAANEFAAVLGVRFYTPSVGTGVQS
jgi:hypothetical protein